MILKHHNLISLLVFHGWFWKIITRSQLSSPHHYWAKDPVDSSGGIQYDKLPDAMPSLLGVTQYIVKGMEGNQQWRRVEELHGEQGLWMLGPIGNVNLAMDGPNQPSKWTGSQVDSGHAVVHRKIVRTVPCVLIWPGIQDILDADLPNPMFTAIYWMQPALEYETDFSNEMIDDVKLPHLSQDPI